ncbi:MAG: TonB-dependent receptor plug domain-containing protein [Pseudomonadota bacterium]
MRKLGFCLWLLLVGTASSLAQTPAGETPFETESGTLVYDRASIDQSGWLTLGDFLASLPQTGTGRTRGANGFTTGDQTVTLGPLGSSRTLVLLNGRRVVEGTGGSADLSTIALSAIERIEISLAGDVAREGAGAVSGTINLITRTSLEGLQVAAQAGEFDEGDGRSLHLDVGYGHSFERGSIYVNASLFDADPVVGAARAISLEPVFGTGLAFGSTFTPQGRFASTELGSFRLTTDPGTLVDDPSDFREGDFSLGTPGAGDDRYNNAAEEFVLHEQDRASLLVGFDWSLTDSVQLEADALYSQRDATLQFAPPVLRLGFFGSVSPDVAADNAFNPFGVTLAGNQFGAARRLVEAGNHRFLQEAEEWRVGGGLTGSIELSGRPAEWQVQWVHNRRDFDANRPLQFDNERLAQSLAGQPCRDDVFGDGCVELNLFGGQGPDGQGTITPAMISYITFDAVDRERVTLNQVTADVSLLGPELAGGAAEFGAGVEWRDESARFDPGRESVEFPLSSPARATSSLETRAVKLWSRLPVTDRLTGELAARYADVDELESLFAARASLTATPVTGLQLTASWSRDYDLPALGAVRSPTGLALVSVADPCSAGPGLGGCDELAGNRLAAGETNRQLDAELTRQWQLAASWDPQRWGLAGWVSYRDLSVDRLVTTLGGQELVNACAAAGQFCNLVGRDAAGGIQVPLSAFVNSGELDLRSVDVGATWASESGAWLVDWQAQYLSDFDRVSTAYANGAPGELPVPAVSTQSVLGVVDGGRVISRWRSNLDARWRSGPWQATWGVRYIHGVDEGCTVNEFGLCNLDLSGDGELDGRRLGSTTYHDVQLAYDLSRYAMLLTVGVQNLLDKGPPLSSQASGNYYTNEYRTPGRFPYVRLSVAF